MSQGTEEYKHVFRIVGYHGERYIVADDVIEAIKISGESPKNIQMIVRHVESARTR